jgi:acyl-CoA synthetase (AMP-forming)/AMP-acid ligase II/acyl carrier protein
VTFSTTYQLLQAQAGRAPESVAILAPGRAPLTYGRLRRQVRDVVSYLNGLGIGRNDRVAIVLPNGPEMAVAFLSVASGATSAPLNPAYRASEFDFYLSDLHAKALVVLAGMDSPAIQVARNRGIAVIDLMPLKDGPAGLFDLSGTRQRFTALTGFAQPEDIALVLHTSETTSRPKIVPLMHLNICTSARNVQAALELTCSDRCLVVMPLFHIHGLIGAALASLVAGASIICTPGFDEHKFFAWIDTLEPTWYTAVPTMHQAVVANAAAHCEITARCSLRLIRSSCSSLPPKVMAELEDVFGAPVIESYGRTEASHQITSNPLPPHQRKAGSVGVAAGPEVAIMDKAGNLVPAGEIGEIVIHGASVTRGYENSPVANEQSFIHGWFRTGDQGFMDADGYFFITGRLKEVIDRGGEKIALQEDEIPKDPTGKLQRMDLGEKLSRELKAAFVPPRDPLEVTLAGIWAEVLDVEQVGIYDNFVALGGDSLRATQLVARVRAAFQVELPLEMVFREPTIDGQASVVEDLLASEIEALIKEDAQCLVG